MNLLCYFVGIDASATGRCGPHWMLTLFAQEAKGMCGTEGSLAVKSSRK